MILYVLSELFSGSGSSDSIQRSTIDREKLESTSLVESDSYYVDTLGWIGSGKTLEEGMKYFYDETGVQPFLVITDSIGSNSVNLSDEELYDFANDVYDEEFTDEAHLVVVFYERDGYYRSCYTVGTEAKTVIDDEAGEILLDYIDHYYYSDYEEDEMFSRSFSEAADRMMKVTPHYGWIVLIFVLIIVVLCITLTWWSKKKKAKLAEMNKAQQILDQELNSFGAAGSASDPSATAYTPPPPNTSDVYDSKEVDELKKKYDNM